MYIPDGYGTVFPYMIVSDMALFTDFIKTVFDAKELGRTVRQGGIVDPCGNTWWISTRLVRESYD